jgi:hypothetical protein
VIIPSPPPDGGFSIPLRASFLVFRKFPLLGVATNNAAPRLILHDDRIEHRVITRQIHRYEELERVDARQALGTQNIILYWRRGVFAFSANLGAENALVELLRFFQSRGIVLTKRATSLLAKHAVF